MNRRTFISSALMALIVVIAGLVINTNTVSAQYTQYVVDINYLVPAPCNGPINFEVHWNNGQIDYHSYTNDGKYLWPQPPLPVQMLGVWICGVFVPVGPKVIVNCPAFGCLPGMCIEIEIRFNNGYYEIKMQPTNC